MSSEPTPAQHQPAFDELLGRIRQTRQAVFAYANTALIDLYWAVGQVISHKVQREAWGKGVVAELAAYIARQAPEIKGFSDKNLWRMKQFYETYEGEALLSPLVREVPWTHNTVIFSRCKSNEERAYYLRQCLAERYSSRELERQINAAQFERAQLSQPKLSAVLRELHPAAGQVFKDNYVLEFLGLPEEHNEADLQRALVGQMKAVILELGSEAPEGHRFGRNTAYRQCIPAPEGRQFFWARDYWRPSGAFRFVSIRFCYQNAAPLGLPAPATR